VSAPPDATHRDYARVAQAVAFVEARVAAGGGPPSVAEVAAHLAMSPAHLRRLFADWAGIAPKAFVRAAAAVAAGAALRRGRTTLDTAVTLGLSSQGRLHDLTVDVDGATPGEVARAGGGATLRTGVHDTPFGPALVAVTGRGVCGLRFLTGVDAAAERAAMLAPWSDATVVEDPAASAHVPDALDRALRGGGRRPGDPSVDRAGDLRRGLRGTNLQVQVWRALLAVPAGAWTTYGDIAAHLGRPTASRAVAGAVARNPVGVLVPCHRVLRGTGALGGYRWGTTRKTALLAFEAVATAEAASA
jgi:AraC family transcriptional regulator, regulatory protein of adaptative response / methylated-DNA-[protein]-cysteine methyltransferase